MCWGFSSGASFLHKVATSIKDGLVDGRTLLALYEDVDAENLLTNASRLNKLMYETRLRAELKMLE